MTSLRRPSQYYGSKPLGLDRPPPMPTSRGGDKKDTRKRVEDRMKTRRMSMRYADNDFGVLAAGASGADFLSADPYQHKLEVAPPLHNDDYDYSVPPVRASPKSKTKTVRPGSVYDGSPRSFAERRLEAEEAQGGNVHDEQIRRQGPKAAAPEWDFTPLSESHCDVGAFIRKALTGADEDEKKRFIAALQKHREANSKDIQTNVFKHYAEFVNISKEISTLENDMLELKELLTEWKTVPQLMGMDDSLAPVLEKDGTVNRHRGKRNSPLDLQQMYRQQLTNLWSTVDGSSKFFTITPGRRLVFETHSFVELNAATYKAKQNVSLFLLNDLLLVAGRRRTKAPPGMGNDPDFERGRMVAERCWVLTDLIVVDLKDSGDLTNALKIKRNKEVCVYRGQRPEDKKALLGAFKQVSSELSEKKRKDNEAEQERRRTLWQGENPGGSRLTMAMSMWGGDQGSARPITTIGTSLTDSKELTWIDEFGDDLTMAIATQDWEKGVALAERGTDLLRTVANNAEATELLQFKLDTLKPNLVKQIARDLSSPKIRKTSASHLIGLLSRLDSAELARDTFLKARHDLMVSLVRGIKHEGDISLYISELSVVCFTIIRHTSDWYMNAFKGNSMASGFTTWAKTQVEYFGDIFRRQVYAPTIDESVVSECLKVTMSANRKLLRDAGLDFTFLLNSVTSSDPEPAPAGFSAAPISAGPPTTFAAMNAGRKVSTGRGDGGYSPLSPDSESGPASLFGRRPRPDGRNVSGASAFSNANSSSASPPRPPPRSERRSRVPGEP